MQKITNAVLASKIEAMDEKVDDIKELQKLQNGRVFDNTKDIARMKGASGVIALTVSLLISCVGLYIRFKTCG